MSALPALPATHPAGCRLVSVDGRALSFQGGDLSVEAVAGLARVVLRQRFANPHAEPLRVTYTVPLPADAAVSGFAFEIGGQRIVGEVNTKQQARQRFEEALIEGRSAALLEQERSSVFHQEVGNIPPGETVVCELVLDQPLAWQDGGWAWRFPTVVAPRYTGSAPAEAPHLDVTTEDTGARVTLSVCVRDPRTGPVTSPTHPIAVHGDEVSLAADTGSALDRDVVVCWPVAAPAPGAQLVVGRDEQAEAGGLLTLVPPSAPMAPVPRDLVVLLDTSGSMGGAPLRQAVAVTTALVETLGEQDQLQLIEFSTRPQAWHPEPVAMSAARRAEAIQWLRSLRAGGGTEMRTGILAALQTLRGEAQRQVVLVTDGLISFEKQISAAILRDLPRGCRVHTLGIGSATNRTLLTTAARAGGGVEAIVGVDESPEAAARALVAATAQPQVVDVSLAGDAFIGCAHHRIPDLLAGRPARIAVRLRPGGGRLVVSGHTAQGPWQQVIDMPPIEPGEGNLAAVKRVGRERVADLELRSAVGESVDAEITEIGLAYQIATRLTSWVAVTEEETVDATAPTRSEVVPQALPYGMSAEGIGLRSPVPAPTRASGSVPRPSAPPRERKRLRRPTGPATASPKKKAELDSLSMGNRGAKGRADQSAPPPPLRDEPAAEGLASFMPLLEEVDDMDMEMPEPAPVAARRLSVRGTILLAKAGRLTLSLAAPQALAWAPPSRVSVRLSDGRVLSVSVDVRKTTRPGSAAAGLVLRLVLLHPGIEQLAGDISEVVVTMADGLNLHVTL